MHPKSRKIDAFEQKNMLQLPIDNEATALAVGS